MPKRGASSHHGLLGEPPTEVEVTVLRGPRGPATRAGVTDVRAFVKLGAGLGLVVVLVVGMAIAGGIVVAASLGGRSPTALSVRSHARQAGPAGVAAAYGYPLRCLIVTVAPHDPRFARADFDRTSRCGRYEGYPTAIFHRAHGAWLPALDATGYSCPVSSLPAAVQRDLAVCP